MDSHFRKTELQSQYAVLRQPGNCPEGVYVTPTPSIDEWSGVVFVRKGYFKGAVLHFRVHFPPAFPLCAPLVVFAKDSLIHPLVDPHSYRLALAAGFPKWDPATDNVAKLLFFIKGIFKDYQLTRLSDGLAVNSEAWRLYQSNRNTFAKLAAQCATISTTPSNLYASAGQSTMHTIDIAAGPQVTGEGTDQIGPPTELTFRHLSKATAEAVRSALFAPS